MPTIHLDAEPGQIAEVVLVPGDPVRSERIARDVLENTVRHNARRNMLGFTGAWRGSRLSVQASGMGAPSMAIYATELFEHYGVGTAVRVGTCGALRDDVMLGDLVIAVAAGTDSSIGRRWAASVAYCPTAPFDLLAAATAAAARHGWTAHTGAIVSCDAFYGMDVESLAGLADCGALAVDMETAALYAVAAAHRRRALSVLTVTDHLGTSQGVSADEREAMFTRSTSVALDAVAACEPAFAAYAHAEGAG